MLEKMQDIDIMNILHLFQFIHHKKVKKLLKKYKD